MTDRPRLRFAPSPTGSLHLGNARTALFNWLIARRRGGTFVLRIEDTDVRREEEGSFEGILEDLHWLGLEWDEGPGRGGEYGPYRQSGRGACYREAADLLLREGRAYWDFSSEEDRDAARPESRAGAEPPSAARARRRRPDAETRRRLDAGEPAALRFVASAPEEEEAGEVRFVDRLRGEVVWPLREIADPVIVRSDGRPTYNFAVVVDDAAMKIDVVLRGDDHLSNTPRQVLLFRALGRPEPEFAHLPMVRGADGGRLSKRHGAVSVAEYRRAGYPVEGLRNALALLGWAPDGESTVLDTDELIRRFDLDAVGRSPATFDPAKLDWICGQHVARMPAERLAAHVGRRLVEAGRIEEAEGEAAGAWLVAVAELLRPSIQRFDQVPARAAGLFHAGGPPDDPEAADALREGGAAEVVRALRDAARRTPPVDLESWRAVKQAARDASGARGRSLFQPMRVAVTGLAHGPDLDATAACIALGHARLPDRVPALAARIERTAEALG